MSVKNKQEALSRLDAIEKEARSLRKIIDAPENILERVTSFQDACRELGKSEGEVYNGEMDLYKCAQLRIETVAEALREGTPPAKSFYYPWFRRSSGGEFSYDVFAYGYVFSSVGARLRVDTSEKAEHLGKCMIEDYKIYLNG